MHKDVTERMFARGPASDRNQDGPGAMGAAAITVNCIQAVKTPEAPPKLVRCIRVGGMSFTNLRRALLSVHRTAQNERPTPADPLEIPIWYAMCTLRPWTTGEFR